MEAITFPTREVLYYEQRERLYQRFSEVFDLMGDYLYGYRSISRAVFAAYTRIPEQI